MLLDQSVQLQITAEDDGSFSYRTKNAQHPFAKLHHDCGTSLLHTDICEQQNAQSL